MAAKKQKLEPVPWRPDYWIDWSDKTNVVVRDGDDQIVYEDLHISQADLDSLRAEIASKRTKH